MAEIKKRPPIFKGKAKGIDKWVCGYYLKDHVGEWIHQGDTCYLIEPESSGQSIGHNDKNGKIIFDGDIVKVEDYTTFIGVVEWDDFDAAIRVDSSKKKYPFAKGNCNFPLFRNDTPKIEVIGNIYDYKKNGGLRA